MKVVERKIKFDKSNSLALKGIAILLMMLHHNFREVSLFEDYTVSFFPFPQEWIVNAASMAKICVSLFAFISGYGLYLSCKNDNSTPTKWVIIRYIKTFSGYWLIWILSAVLTQIINGRFAKIYLDTNIWDAMVNIVLDFAGLANLFHSPTLNGTWWYMSAAFIFIIITPLLVKNEEYLTVLLLVVVVFLRMITGGNGEGTFTGGNSTWSFLAIFMLGMIFAKYNIIERIVNAKGKWLRFVVECVLLAVAYKVYNAIDISSYWELNWALIPLIVIMFSVEFVMYIPVVRQILLYLGRHSMNIFMVHTFIRHYYLADFTYSWKYFGLIIVVLLVCSLIISTAVELLKKAIKYDMYVNKICDCIYKF